MDKGYKGDDLMKKLSVKIIALACCTSLLLSVAGCSTKPNSGGRRHDDETKPEGGRVTDPTYETDPTDPTDPTSPTQNPGNYGLKVY